MKTCSSLHIAAMLGLILLCSGCSARELLQDDCVSMGSSIISTSCSAFVNTFENAADSLSNATDAQLAAYLNTVPPPSPGCCSASAPFVDEACQCDPSLTGLAGFYGLTPEGVITIARLAKMACGTKYIAQDISPFCNGTAPSSG